MVQKSSAPWRPRPKGHVNAGAILSRKATSLGKSAGTVQRKLASFRAAAKLANRPPATEPLPPHLTPPSNQPPAGAPLKTSLPPKLPTTPGAD